MVTRVDVARWQRGWNNDGKLEKAMAASGIKFG
jgi:hypothetical protein